MTNTIHIATSGADEAFPGDQPIMAGDTPPMATRDVLFPLALGAIPQYTPLSFASGAYKVWAAGETVVAMTAYAVPDSAADQRAAVYTAGMFNIDAVNWPATTTEDQVAAATINSQVQFRKLLYSDKRVAKSGLLVGPAYTAPTTG
jgi:hypothetical protein